MSSPLLPGNYFSNFDVDPATSASDVHNQGRKIKGGQAPGKWEGGSLDWQG